MSNSIKVVAKRNECSVSSATRKVRGGYLWAMKQARKRGNLDHAAYCRKRYDALK